MEQVERSETSEPSWWWRVLALIGRLITWPVSVLRGGTPLEESAAEGGASPEGEDDDGGSGDLKNIAERKKKSAQERKTLEEELEELKAQHEEDIANLKEKLRKQKSSIDASSSEQVTRIEEDLNQEWKEKFDRMVKSTQDKHQGALQDLQEEKEDLQDKLDAMEKKMAEAKAVKGDTNKQMQQLQQEVHDLQGWKDKYESLRTQATSMKEKYEARIQELGEEADRLVAEAKTAAATEGAGSGGLSREAVVGEVKKIMSSVYHELKGEFDADKTYKGSDIHTTILGTVKSTTMKMVREAEEEEEDEYSGQAEVMEKMEVASVGGGLTAPAPKAADKKKSAATEKKAKGATGGFSLAALEGSIITGDATIQDKTKAKSTEGKSDPKKAKVEDKTKPQKAPVTGDKGNPYYAEELRKAAEMAKAKETKVHAPVTGDKGNPYYAEELKKAAAMATSAGPPLEKSAAATTSAIPPPVKSSVAMTTSAPPPVKSSKDDKTGKKTDKKEESKDAKAVDKGREKDKEVFAGVCGDKGNPHYAAELRRAAEQKAEDIEKKLAQVTGDKGNPYYAAELSGKKLESPTEPKKRSQEEVLKGLEAAIFAGADIVLEDEKAKGKKADGGKAKDGKPGQSKKDGKGEKAASDKGKAGDKKEEVVDPLFGAVTAPAKPAGKKSGKTSLFEDDKPLFEEDKDTVGDMLGKKTAKDAKTDTKAAAGAKPDAKKPDAKKTDAKKTDAKKTDAKKTDAKKGSDSDEDFRMKPPPPPLFGDDDDDDDLDWLS